MRRFTVTSLAGDPGGDFPRYSTPCIYMNACVCVCIYIYIYIVNTGSTFAVRRSSLDLCHGGQRSCTNPSTIGEKRATAARSQARST